MCVLVLREFAELVEPLAGAFAQDVSRLGAGFGCQQRNLAAVAYALFQHLLRVFGVLGDTVLGRDRLCEVTQQCRHVFQALTWDLDLTPRHCLYGFHGQLIGLAQRLDVAALAGHHCLDIKRSKAKISHHFDHVKIEKARASLCVSHRSVPVQGGFIHCALHNNSYIGPLPVQSSPLLQRSKIRRGAALHCPADDVAGQVTAGSPADVRPTRPSCAPDAANRSISNSDSASAACPPAAAWWASASTATWFRR